MLSDIRVFEIDNEWEFTVALNKSSLRLISMKMETLFTTDICFIL